MSETGWRNPRPMTLSSKFHYIDPSGRSLCGKWLRVGGTVEEGKDEHSDNCKECMRRKKKNDA